MEGRSPGFGMATAYGVDTPSENAHWGSDRVNVERVVEDIVKDRQSGATTLIRKALQLLVSLIENNVEMEEIRSVVERLYGAHRGIASWGRFLDEVKERLHKEDPLKELKDLQERFEYSESQVSEIAARDLKGYGNVLTISFSSVVVSTLLKADMKRVYVMESRPMCEGHITAERLIDGGVDAVLIVDAASGELIREGKVDVVLVGADAIFEDYLVNKVGTLPLALLADRFNVPFHVVAQWFKIIPCTYEQFYKENPLPPGGLRPSSEVHSNFKAMNFYFDLTPTPFITILCTDAE